MSALPVLQVRPGPQEPTETGRWHWVNVELIGAEKHVPVLSEDPPRRSRPDVCSTDTGCRTLLSGAAGMEKDIPLSARRANVLRGGYLTPCRAPAESRGGVPPHTAPPTTSTLLSRGLNQDGLDLRWRVHPGAGLQ